MASDLHQTGRGRWRLLKRHGEQRSGSLVQAADDFVERLNLPTNAAWNDLQAAVESVYGKPIYLIASGSAQLSAITGIWIDTAKFGAVVCRERDELHYQSQNACHQLAHILFVTAPANWFNDFIPQSEPTATITRGATQLCPAGDDPDDQQLLVELAVEEVAFAMARRIQTVNRSAEEAYFG
jgi:hypothetical protein